jgi:hypothetical protein
VNLNG